ncbi:hypothetical protein MPTK1_6g09230 [Marchantia polymorpha subsp. ruderalis]|uniref:Uncharacterized protein n=2 Tax=Marchantia polymorpha TaxID=3197 RepID=A0A176VSN3_MARPO|nr:hypothetical protein AXG93_3903s1030 [Marchantia polymorpha subsp. ruderalis]PTQ28918.1 hypothetical protein MARPO_0152s0031 [Marchantia polymorpha]BBN14144.1 hypothetical protein Mp_6g09230 [Marchantia polymorpha subsp. ruderalis]|eukprot:PTQ28918.1 hypothetical protein MARPO_0152s0031 [Marchantia polymorpha]
MAQVMGDKDVKNVEHPIHDDPLHDVKGQIESGVGTIKSEPLFEGASRAEKLPESRVGDALLTDSARKLESTGEPMDTAEAGSADPQDLVVKSDVAETFASEFKENHGESSGDKKEESVSDDGGDAGKSELAASGDDDAQGSQEHPGTKFKKLTGAGIPRGKPHFRVSAHHGNRGLGDASLQSGGLGGGLGGSGGLRGSSRGGGGLARTGSGLGSGLARTGSGIPQGSNELKDFSAALAESDTSKSSDSLPASLPPSTDAKSQTAEETDAKLGDATDSETAVQTEDAAADKVAATREAVAEKMIAAKETIMEKAGEVKMGFVATLKDQLLPIKDPQVGSSDMEVDDSAPAKFSRSQGPKLGIYRKD